MARPAVQTAVRRARINVSGAVQGVGFRPYVYRLATALGLGGWVRNTPRGVQIDAEGEPAALAALLDALRAAPAPARVDAIETDWQAAAGASGFAVAASEPGAGPALPLPDLAVCADCLADIRDPAGRRFDYAFTSCSRCGPRYSIIAGLPYDRARTAMAGFAMCAACAAEYADPADRRFHHQANACPACGPRLTLHDAAGTVQARDSAALDAAAHCLRAGGIVALMGIGGFQLLVDARDEAAVARLRARKRRPDKPFAVMFADGDAVQAACATTPDERALLAGPAAPIVLLERRRDGLAPSVAPGQARLGALVPYSPLHALLLDRLGFALVATSGNRAGEPLCTTPAEAQARLAGIADVFLVHDRPILRALDDSLVQVAAGRPQVLRLARGYAPLAVDCPDANEPALALGGHLKAAVAVGGGGRIVLGQHLGDLDGTLALAGFDAAAQQLPALAGAAAGAPGLRRPSGLRQFPAGGRLRPAGAARAASPCPRGGGDGRARPAMARCWAWPSTARAWAATARCGAASFCWPAAARRGALRGSCRFHCRAASRPRASRGGRRWACSTRASGLIWKASTCRRCGRLTRPSGARCWRRSNGASTRHGPAASGGCSMPWRRCSGCASA